MRRTVISGSVLAVPFLLTIGSANVIRKPAGTGEVRFNRDVRPILSDLCFNCHGFDEKARKGERRLDTKDGAFAEHEGVRAIVPGDLTKSELVKRIRSVDPDDQMPPPKEVKRLSPEQRQVLERWIEQGAPYEDHWAYVVPAKVEVEKGRNPVDTLISRSHQEHGVKAAPEADRRTLHRRLSFDLLGLPPQPEEVDAFVADKSPEAYGRLVDRLLANPAFGERMAVPWLDVVRFADTIGYHSDTPRNVWPYRDYVIDAFNRNLPFDRFVREQVAGDLLEGSGVSQKVASGFNRLNLSTEEGGAQAKDYEVRMMTDRVRAIGTVFLGQTIGCAQCHDHKYDPISTRDFYRMGAFFADIKESAIGRREDGMLVPSAEQEARLKDFDQRIALAQGDIDRKGEDREGLRRAWELTLKNGPTDVAWAVLKPSKVQSEKGMKFTLEADGTVVAGKDGAAQGAPTKPLPVSDAYVVTVVLPEGGPWNGLRLEALADEGLPAKGPGLGKDGNFLLTDLSVKDGAEVVVLAEASATFEQKGYPAKNAITGRANDAKKAWGIGGGTGKDQSLYVEFGRPVAGGRTLVVTLRQIGGETQMVGRFRLGATHAPTPVRAPSVLNPANILAIIVKEESKRSPQEAALLEKHFRAVAPVLAPQRVAHAKLVSERTEFEKTVPRTLVSVSDKPRTVKILHRGDWQDDKGEEVTPGLPGYLSKKEGGDRRLTRLDLAEWLVSKENPLTARVFVNRVWKQFFGTGLSKVLDDFGAQGEAPLHGELLDWLAAEFRDGGWNVKGLVRLIVTSDAYRRSSVASAAEIAADPLNRELGRQGRWRHDAEFVRDNALQVAGLLVNRVGGPSVKPYQPDGYWENLNFPVRTWQADTGESQYRRGLYTWWQRSFLHPSMLAFDAPSREECVAERNRSNIPQQALVLLNDPTFVESARALAASSVGKGANHEARLDWMFRKVLQRVASPVERKTLLELVGRHQAGFAADRAAAKDVLTVGLAARPEGDEADIAAWTSVARVLLNLHETVSRF
ncbi:MAG: hypothetical protein RIS92_1782 [Verrucomicrobiota bacterium]